MAGPYTLTGSGTQSIAQPAQLAVALSGLSSSYITFGRATPANYYNAGIFRLGNANGYYKTIGLDAVNQLIDCPGGCTELGYYLGSGVTAVVTEITPGQTSNTAVEPAIISSATAYAMGGAAQSQMAAAVGGVAGVANGSILIPFIIHASHLVHRMFCYVTSGGGSNHLDMGIYSSALARLGSTGTTVNPTGLAVAALSGGDLVLTPGEYYLGFGVDSATPLYLAGATSAAKNQLLGVKQMTASAYPLPATFVPIATMSLGSVPWVGFTSNATP